MKKLKYFILFFTFLGNIGIIIHVVSDKEFTMSLFQVFVVALAISNLYFLSFYAMLNEEKEADQ
jgi:hypothetical protein